MPQTPWPALPYAAWKDTCDTLHLWLQVVGKVRLKLTPWMNHSWNATFYVEPRGLTTSPIPGGGGSFDMTFDFLDQALLLRDDRGAVRRLPLQAESVASFHARVMAALRDLGVEVRIDRMPNEVPDPVRFDLDTAPRTYDPGQALDYWRVLVRCDQVFKRFRTAFLGKSSPVHLFWGSMDLAVTRFSGRRAPLHPGGVPGLPDAVTREAYSHEVSSAGFWPGGGGMDEAAFYAYAYPAPAGFAEAEVRPAAARFDAGMGEFILPYDAVRTAPDPDAALLDFLQSTYVAAADAGGWDRSAVECPLGIPGAPRPVG
jgi:hypothetical protein